MTSAFDPKNGQWRIAWPQRISRHDLIYLTPPDDPMNGLAVGNGDLGAMLWFERTRIVIVVNKCDLWDDAAFDQPFSNWDGDQEEFSTTLRHGGRIVIDFHQPLFDLFYMKDACARISLADATIRATISGPLGEVELEAFVARQENTLCLTVRSRLPEDIPLEIAVERFGSRMFHHWYCVTRSNPELGLLGTAAKVRENTLFVTHQLNTGTFALGARVLPEKSLAANWVRQSAHRCACTLTGSAEKSFSLLATITSPMDRDPIAEAKCHLNAAGAAGVEKLFAPHAEAWKAFWLRSLMDTGRPYLDQLWHLIMYYLNSCQGGRYPGRFIDGLWTTSGDFQAWGFFFHWNQQQLYWPLNAAGHHELVRAYLDWRFTGLPHAQHDAAEIFHAPPGAAVVSDVVERRGINSKLELGNHTPGAQIALEFWRQYRYTGDVEFLRRFAIPYMVGACIFFEKLFEKDENGVYHAAKGTGYEGGTELRDCVTELACAKALYRATLEALDIAGVSHERSTIWRDILDHMAPFMVVEADPRAIDPKTREIKRGRFKGRTARNNLMFAAGYGLKRQEILTSLVPYDEPEEYQVGEAYAVPHIHHRPAYRINSFLNKLAAGLNPYVPDAPEMSGHETIFPYVEYAAVFPCNVLGLADRDSQLFEAAVNTVKLYATMSITWDPMPIVMARLGLGEELADWLSDFGDYSAMYHNGMFSDGPAENTGPDSPLVLRSNRVWDRETKDRSFPLPSKPFRHFAFEVTGVLTCAMNESLMQSHDEIIRVAPAVTAGQAARFTLHAVGGFVVSGEIEGGQPKWIAVESLRGGDGRIENPWPAAFLYRDGRFDRSCEDRVIEFAAKPGERIMLTPDRKVMDQWRVECLSPPEASEPTHSKRGVRIIGQPRMF